MTFVRRNPSRQTITPERLALYERVADVSRAGRSLFAQAEALGLSHGQLKHLRRKAYVYGFEISPVNPENRRGISYEKAEEMDARAAASVPRCPRCHLALPCNACIPTIAEIAASRRGMSAGAW